MVVRPGIQRFDPGHLGDPRLIQRNIDLKCGDKVRDDLAAQIVDVVERGCQLISLRSCNCQKVQAGQPGCDCAPR